ncbi:MAG: hypothetical protein AABZ06_02765 [Bdellovibrionota bacterium]
MIYWKDFILDDFIGPTLVVDLKQPQHKKRNRGAPLANQSIMEDAAEQIEATRCASVQETRQSQRPARMVGISDLAFTQTGMDASRDSRARSKRRMGG